MRVDAIREDRHRGGRSSYEGSRFQLPRGTLFKRKYIENIYGGVELVYAFQVPAEPVVPKLIAEIVKINDVILLILMIIDDDFMNSFTSILMSYVLRNAHFNVLNTLIPILQS